MHNDDDVIYAMLEFGGSFVQALARAYRAADPENRRRIRSTWPEYWQKYSTLAQHRELNRDWYSHD